MSRFLLLATESASEPSRDDLGQWTVPASDPETAVLPYTIPTSAPYNVMDWMKLPTEGGLNESVHPAVLDFHPNTWNGHRYWMGVTGYKDGQNRGENPHIFYSDNAYNWSLPAGVPAPLIASPGSIENPDQPFNSDTELVYDPANNTLNLFYRVTQEINPTYEQLWRITSSNGTTWSSPTLALETVNNGPQNFASPTIVRIPGVGWRMWAVQGLGTSLRYWTATTLAGPWTLGGTCTMTGTAHDLWHLQVVRHGTRLYMAGDGFEDDGIFPAISDDNGLSWKRGENFIVSKRGVAGWWDSRPYRTSLFMHPSLNKFRIWYSAQGGPWYSGYTHAPRSLWDSLA